MSSPSTRCSANGELDEERLLAAVRLGVRFLDAVIDTNRFPTQEIRNKTLLNRKIGLGIMGLADALILLGIPYQSDEALEFADSTMALISREAHEESRRLGEEKGSFPAIDRSVCTTAMRNATVTTIAPTGSLHLIEGTSPGIEPLISLASSRRIGNRLVPLVHPLLKEYLGPIRSGDEILTKVKRTGSLASTQVPDDVRELYRTAPEISADHHVRMQAVFQRHVDNVVSETVNLPEEADAEEISRIYLLARSLGCKRVTIYRYNSKRDQVLLRGCEICGNDFLTGSEFAAVESRVTMASRPGET